MKISIKYKLFFIFLAAIFLVVIGMFFLIQWSFDRGFLNYINTIELQRLDILAQRLEENYKKTGSWDYISGNRQLWNDYLRDTGTEIRGELPAPSLPQPMPLINYPGSRGLGFGQKKGPERVFLPPEIRSLFIHRVIFKDAGKKVIFGPHDHPETLELRVLKADGKTIGYLGLIPQEMLSSNLQLNFLKQQKRTFALIAFAIVVFAALLSFPLARHMVKKIEALADATHRLVSGRYDTRVSMSSSDELGKLAMDFDTLAFTLEKNEQARNQWIADISHELRTPLSVLRGEIEALQDGIRPNNSEALSSLHSEVIRLGRLVDDLYQLSLSDAGALTYRKHELNLYDMIIDVVESFRIPFKEKAIKLNLHPPEDSGITILADPDRLHQLFDNLMNNSLKYTNHGGRLDIRIEREKDKVIIHFQDSNPCVPEADMEKLFDRLYRADRSRNRSYGGAGLGLAICKNIIEAHNGSIDAHNSPLGGLWLEIILPLSIE